MKKHLFNYFLLVLFIIGSEISTAQKKNIDISHALSENAEMMKVKMGAQWMGKMWRMKFGDYSIGKNKMGREEITQNSNRSNIEVDSNIGYKFNFELNNKTSESAIVSAVFSKDIKHLQSTSLAVSFHGGSDSDFSLSIDSDTSIDEVLRDSLNFISGISLKSNKKNQWNLYFVITSGTDINYKNGGVLTDGERIIVIRFVTSNQDGNDNRKLPATGYEFSENGKSICAMQYYGGGYFGLNKNIFWIDSSLNQDMKLILAATMASILQVKFGEMGNINIKDMRY